MKTMYTGKKIQNLLIIICCVLLTLTIYSFDRYLNAKEQARDEYFRTGKQTELNYFAFVSNGLTINQN